LIEEAAAIMLGEYEEARHFRWGRTRIDLETWAQERREMIRPKKLAAHGQIPDIDIVREAEILRTLDHPGLVNGYEIRLPPSPGESILVLIELM
jgi:hypothetical protein